MAIPQTIFELIDESQFLPINPQTDNQPLFMAAFTSDKGPENLRVCTASDFFTLYGDISFARHGQPLLQAARTIQSGAKLLCQRVTAADAAMANAILVLKTNIASVQKTDAQGQPLYKDKVTGQETTTAEGNDAIMISKMHVKWEISSTTSLGDIKTLEQVASELLDEKTENKVYPLLCIADIGKGISNKKFRIAPDLEAQKRSVFAQNTLAIMEKNETLERYNFSMDYDRIYNGAQFGAQSQVNKKSSQVKLGNIEVGIDAYANYFLKYLNTKHLEEHPTEPNFYTIEDVWNCDILFFTDSKGAKFKDVVIDDGSVNISNTFGINLINGTNGSFGAAPKNSPSYGQELAKVFSGAKSNEIYDLDKYKIDAIVDADYPAAVKRAIENLVDFREDCFFFRDCGVGVSDIETIVTTNAAGSHTKFVGAYHMSYDIIDPYSQKQIGVTCGYTLANLLVDHFKNRRNRPIAGQLFGMVLSEAVADTINFVPVITPSMNQKQMLIDERINYAGYQDGRLVIETEHTQSPIWSQFSYINNILAIQQLMKAIRSRCPVTRYTFMDKEDLEEYKADVQRVIDEYANNFFEITFEYLEDVNMEANKIFYAAIKVKFRDFIQSEYFKVYAIKK